VSSRQNPIEALAGAVWHGVAQAGDLARGGVGLVTHPERMLSAALQVSAEAVTVVRSVVAPETTRPRESDVWSVAPQPAAPAEPVAPVEEAAPAEDIPPAPQAAPTPRPAPPAPPPDPPAPFPSDAELHVETEEELVAEFADAGAEDGAGAELRVEPPWDDYTDQTADEIVERIPRATDEELAVVELYERLHRGRPTVLQRAERELARRT
jgi:hypothetical protein